MTAQSSAAGAPAPVTRSHMVVTPTSALRGELRAGTLRTSQGLSNICAAHGLACLAQVVTAKKGSVGPLTSRRPIGYGAHSLERAYGISHAPKRTGTIVVIGAGAYPKLAADLATYRAQYRLHKCTVASGCFRQMNYKGGAPYRPAHGRQLPYAEEEIAVETALDVDMASAACPTCKIVSMQVPLRDGLMGGKKRTHAAELHFATGVQTASRLGARAVSISYGYPAGSYSDKGAIAKLMRRRGMPIVASSGDYGFVGRHAQWPQSLRTVTAVGGTSLYHAAGTKRGYREVAWNDAGSGCSRDLRRAEGQPRRISLMCHGHRATSDISAVADPYTGVAVYDSYAPGTHRPSGFLVVGGTSAASPFVAGMYARARRNPAVLGPNTLYAAKRTAFHDVTLGTNAGLGYCATVRIGNAVCDARRGWDGPTGRGSPHGLRPFRP